jgi:hypothetical protein
MVSYQGIALTYRRFDSARLNGGPAQMDLSSYLRARRIGDYRERAGGGWLVRRELASRASLGEGSPQRPSRWSPRGHDGSDLPGQVQSSYRLVTRGANTERHQLPGPLIQT